ncbi:hypothetical protein DICSQDRAFT_175932 [Dichomitus squalens LYAD-421 SS1]|uniref:Uncharacterized protein n=1 Tax=Dichomitus squalens (strain LYAD-421) TaxID=732165 RepID=R7SK45_DICSQ|nr:uncharacterized protein DICSQDRAFT_175932 [Dichomitus squalens LYAD-421 SS1]EJF55422.1 hypothetical protein DICSQDRAFT_175932 [Dichomitus squalens LYAD-421 SS1]
MLMPVDSDGSPSGSSVGSRGATVPVSGSTGGRTGAVAYGSGTTKAVTIPQGQPFAGRTSGGATRDSIYGNSYYGSGYPGLSGLGVASRGFPFVYWPLIWGGGLGYGAAYLHDNHEYGEPNNSSRPGGPMAQAAFFSNSTNTTFHIVSDNSTVFSLIGSITMNCTVASNSSTIPSPFNGSATDPLPEQAIQYYRASSVALTLDGYNNTAALAGNETTPPPLPSGIDTNLLNCLNATIGEAVPLFQDSSSSGSTGSVGAAARLSTPTMGLVGLIYVVWCLGSLY